MKGCVFMPKYKDETGHKYGKLTVLQKTDKTNSKREVYWKCKCECGNEVEVLGRLLRNGTTQSCGCLRKGSKIIDEVGHKYGTLTVISQAKEKVNNHIAWNCRCECGNMIVVSGSKLRSGEISTCSICAKQKLAINEIGNIYGDLTVIKRSYSNQNRNAMWECQCSCGKMCIVSGRDLRSGVKTNCGCKKVLSKGAAKIKSLLTENNISFITEKTFDDCRFPDTNQLARFDFYLPDYQIIIEYDGEQHFFYSGHAWDTKEHFEYTKAHDAYKTKWCEDNHIQLIRIPYYDYKNLNWEKLKVLLF